MPVTGKTMAGFWGNKKNDQDTGVSADFQHALMQEVMKTELLRIKALIATALVLCVIVRVVFFFAPGAVAGVWHGNLTPRYLYSIIGPFTLFKGGVPGSTQRQMKGGRALPLYRRY